MRQDGDPGSDDYGLPRVDVVVPDDARELERDLLAYRREERQRRRRERLRRVFLPLTRYGLAAPMIAGAVLIAIISGTLMTTLGPHSAVPSVTNTLPATQAPLRPGVAGAPLPSGQVVIDGRIASLTDLQGPGIIALVPEGCACDQAIRNLARQTQAYDLRRSLAGSRHWTSATGKELRRLAALIGPGVSVVQDEQALLATAYGPRGLTVLLVHADGIVGAILPNVGPTSNIDQAQLNQLHYPGFQPLAR